MPELFSNPRNVKSDSRMVETAIRRGYPITPEMRQFVINQLVLIIGQSEEERSRIAASRAFFMADKLNIDIEALQMEHARQDRPQVHLHAHSHEHDGGSGNGIDGCGNSAGS